MNRYLANSNLQPLDKHLIGVTKKALALLESFNLENKDELIPIIIYGSLLHDIGKVWDPYQNNVNKVSSGSFEDNINDDQKINNLSFKWTYHNEISFAFAALHLKLDKLTTIKCVNFIIYAHHPINTEKNSNRPVFSDSEDILYEACKNDHQLEKKLHEFWNYIKSEVKKYPFFEKYASYFDRPEYISYDKIKTGFNTKVKIDINLEALKLLSLTILNQANKSISNLSKEDLDLYLNDELSSSEDSLVDDKLKIKLKKLDKHDKRTYEQFKLAEEMLEQKFSVLATDPASGKTRISLLAHFINRQITGKGLYYVHQRQILVAELIEKEIQKDVECILDNHEEITFEGVYNGIKQHPKDKKDQENFDDLFISDINSLVIDRVLNPFYNKNRSSEFFEILNSDLILDEFHLLLSEIKLIFPVQLLIRIRSWINNGTKTFFLSGTPDPSLIRVLFGDINNQNDFRMFPRERLSPTNSSRRNILFTENMPDKIENDTLLSFNSVSQTQEFLLDTDRSLDKVNYIHYKFKNNVKHDKTTLIKEESSKLDSDKITVSSKMLINSLNLNFKNGVIKNAHPNDICQFMLRICRFENKTDGKVFIVNEKDISLFGENKFGFKDVYLKWLNFLKKNLSEKNQYTARQIFTELYDKFWSDDEIVNISHEYIEKQIKKQTPKNDGWFPTRQKFILSEDSPELNIRRLPRHSLRSHSFYITAVEVDDNGKFIGQITGDDLLTVSAQWEIDILLDATNSLTDSDINYLIKNGYNFKYSKYSKYNYGKNALVPLVTSLIKKNSRVNDILERNGLLRYYHKDFGLIEKEIFLKLKDKLPQRKP